MNQNSPEWDLFRRNKIGASDAPAICGVDPYKKPEKLWKQKFTGEKQWVSPWMERGKRLEPLARDMLKEVHGIYYEPIVLESTICDFMIASLDGFDEKSKTGVEIKCPGEKTFNKIILDKEIPKNYIYQIQHQLFVTGFEEWTLVPFNGMYFEEIMIYRDEKIIDEILKKAKFFYDSLIYGEYTPYPGGVCKDK